MIVIHYSEMAHYQIIMLKAVIQCLAILPKASSRFIRILNNSQIWSILNGNKSKSFPAKSNYSARTDVKLKINNITQCQSGKGMYLTGFYHLQAGIAQNNHYLTIIGAPEWPSTTSQLILYVWTMYQVHHDLKIIQIKNQ